MPPLWKRGIIFSLKCSEVTNFGEQVSLLKQDCFWSFYKHYGFIVKVFKDIIEETSRKVSFFVKQIDFFINFTKQQKNERRTNSKSIFRNFSTETNLPVKSSQIRLVVMCHCKRSIVPNEI